MSVNNFETDQPISPRLPRQWSWAALLVIAALAGVGFIRGLGDSRPIEAILAPVKSLPSVAALTAADAAALPHNDDWSVLSGPKILPPAPSMPVKAHSNDDNPPSDAAEKPAAAAQVDAQAPDDMPAPDDTPAASPPASPPPQ